MRFMTGYWSILRRILNELIKLNRLELLPEERVQIIQVNSLFETRAEFLMCEEVIFFIQKNK